MIVFPLPMTDWLTGRNPVTDVVVRAFADEAEHRKVCKSGCYLEIGGFKLVGAQQPVQSHLARKLLALCRPARLLCCIASLALHEEI